MPTPSNFRGRRFRRRVTPAPSTWGMIAIGTVLLVVGATSVMTPDEQSPTPHSDVTQPSDDRQPSDDTADTTADTTALAMLATLPVKGRSPKTGYDRTGQFGSAWVDVDDNGCDTRNDILTRDLAGAVRSGACTVLRGTLREPYTGVILGFVRGNDTSALVQIDHVVALSNAWQTGAQRLTPAERVAFANDPLNLLAVDGSANAQKGDGDAATWLPPAKSFRCAYIARQISVKAAYELWVTRPEKDAMARVLSTCTDERAIVQPQR